MRKIGVKHIKRKERYYSYLYPFKDLAKGSFDVCIK
jgi:hypothetical protein